MVSIIVSCEKENYEIYPKKYIFTDIIYGEVNTYTNSGNINEPDKIYSFLENFRMNNRMYGSSGYTLVTGSLLNIYEDQPTNIPFKLYDEIELISNSQAKITSNDTVIHFDVIRKNGILHFQSFDIIIGSRDIFEPDSRPYYIKPYYGWSEKLKYSPLYIDTVKIWGVGGGILRYDFKPCIYAIEIKDGIQISYTCYVERTMMHIDVGTEGFYYHSNHGALQNVQNDFNRDYLLSYKADDNLRRDTIVYKTNTIIFKKK
ncbi:MAG: hypothetical protein FWH39_02235 [Bacteroidales bacterium]|nr:hypothetical protein [Bacteroidales bacterium]